jgi:hypothetical protein
MMLMARRRHGKSLVAKYWAVFNPQAHPRMRELAMRSARKREQTLVIMDEAGSFDGRRWPCLDNKER